MREFESLVKSRGWGLLVSELEEAKHRIVHDALNGQVTDNEAENSAYLKGFYQGISRCLDLPEQMVENYYKPLVDEMSQEQENGNG